VISANNDHGVLISGNGNAVEGNYVGLDENGASGPGNILDGVHVVGSQNLVRGNAAGDNRAGVALDGSSNSVIANTLGTAAASNDDGVLVIGGNTNVVGGDEEDERNVISGNNDSGVDIEGGQNHRVEGNRIGTDADGVVAVANGNGVSVESSFNVVADNLLSGNNDAGVMLDGDGVGPPPIGNTVERNVIGLDAGGSAALPNEYGVVVEDSHRNAITDNVISDNTGHGVLIDSLDLANTDGNWLTGNTISDNGLSGVRIDDADDNSVGIPDRPVNTITGNAQDGVAVDSGQGNAVANNSIYGNDDLGIDLDDDGPTANDGLGDPDTGANGLQNHPTITGHVLVPVALPEFPFVVFESEISWTLRSDLASDYRLEFYLNDTCAGRGEAKDLLATQQVATDANGLAEGTVRLSQAVEEKVTVTATPTDPNGVVLGPTSELSPCG
jgi:parallel beta-helix repeat protein